jgi:phage-related protein
MAARINKIRHDDETRAKIQATQLIKRLTDHALSEVPIMESTQVKAIEILLKKTLPDLSNVQVGGDPNNPVKAELEVSWKSNDDPS